MSATATTTLSALKANPLGYGPFRTMRIGAISVYAVWAGLSVIWALSGGTSANPIGAVVRAGHAAEGATYISVRNASSEPWTAARVRLDNQWLLEIGDVAAGASADVQVVNFVNAFALPRPTGLYFWEDGAAPPAPPLYAPATYAPSTIMIETDQGHVETPVEF
jgi:hypothetical protein